MAPDDPKLPQVTSCYCVMAYWQAAYSTPSGRRARSRRR